VNLQLVDASIDRDLLAVQRGGDLTGCAEIMRAGDTNVRNIGNVRPQACGERRRVQPVVQVDNAAEALVGNQEDVVGAYLGIEYDNCGPQAEADARSTSRGSGDLPGEFVRLQGGAGENEGEMRRPRVVRARLAQPPQPVEIRLSKGGCGDDFEGAQTVGLRAVPSVGAMWCGRIMRRPALASR
jgi:hypothetical protein